MKHKDLLSQQKFGLASLVRQKYSLPEWLPINAEIQHGWYPSNTFFQKVRKNKCQLVWSERMIKSCRQSGVKYPYCIGAPFVSFRHKYGITKKDFAEGTVVFPQHSTEGEDVLVDWVKLADKLKNFPQEFQPVTVCLYYLDFVKKDIRSQFEKNFKVVTAGNIYNPEFAANFYEILSNHKYATSNTVSTFTFYAIEMGIPFFITNQEFSYIHKFNSEELGTGHKDWLTDKDSEYANAYKLFTDHPSKKISVEQIKYTHKELGINSGTKRQKVRVILFFTGLKIILKDRLKELLNLLKR